MFYDYTNNCKNKFYKYKKSIQIKQEGLDKIAICKLSPTVMILIHSNGLIQKIEISGEKDYKQLC